MAVVYMLVLATLLMAGVALLSDCKAFAEAAR